MTTAGHRYYYYTHFTDEEIKYVCWANAGKNGKLPHEIKWGTLRQLLQQWGFGDLGSGKVPGGDGGWGRGSTSLLNPFSDTVPNLHNVSGTSPFLWSCFRQLCSIIFLILRSPRSQGDCKRICPGQGSPVEKPTQQSKDPKARAGGE